MAASVCREQACDNCTAHAAAHVCFHQGKNTIRHGRPLSLPMHALVVLVVALPLQYPLMFVPFLLFGALHSVLLLVMFIMILTVQQHVREAEHTSVQAW